MNVWRAHAFFKRWIKNRIKSASSQETFNLEAAGKTLGPMYRDNEVPHFLLVVASADRSVVPLHMC